MVTQKQSLNAQHEPSQHEAELLIADVDNKGRNDCNNQVLVAFLRGLVGVLRQESYPEC